MPYHQADAPPGTPPIETIESLMGRANERNSRTRKIKTLSQLTPEEKQKTGLITLGQRCIEIPGDPFGVYHSWSGNVAHPRDEQMMEVMSPIFDDLKNSGIDQSDLVQAIEALLQKVSTTPMTVVAKEMANDGKYDIIREDDDEITVDFRLKSLDVRITMAKDIDKEAEDPYDRTNRARHAVKRAREAFDEPPMSIAEQQQVMADILREENGHLAPDAAETGKGFFANLRSLAQEKFWLLVDDEQRARYRTQATESASKELSEMLALVRANWQSRWDNSRSDPDFFYHYARDRAAAERAWDLVTADIFIVVDCNGRVIFANIERLAQILYGEQTVDVLLRALDLWSYYTPLPAPETRRHVVDRYVRRIHRELDAQMATVDQLPQAKMAVAHLGCWAPLGHSSGRYIVRTADASFTKAQSMLWSRLLFGDFCTAVLGKATNMIRFMVRSLDPEYYTECVDIVENLPAQERLKTDEQDFLSLFALGVNAYTQRHRDVGDMRGGLAGLITLGNYTGGNLCVPALGIKVPYRPGSCTIIRGDKLEHLVSDYSGPRYFIIGTNHETARRYVRRHKKLKAGGPDGRGVLLDEPSPIEGHESESDDAADFPLKLPCVSQRSDEDDDDIIYQNNKSLHGARALDSGSSHCS